MTPKEKAEELFNKFHLEVLDRDGTSAMNGFEAKQCALIAVDECLVAVESDWGFMQRRIEFWQEVKIEIENYDSN